MMACSVMATPVSDTVIIGSNPIRPANYLTVSATVDDLKLLLRMTVLASISIIPLALLYLNTTGILM